MGDNLKQTCSTPSDACREACFPAMQCKKRMTTNCAGYAACAILETGDDKKGDDKNGDTKKTSPAPEDIKKAPDNLKQTCSTPSDACKEACFPAMQCKKRMTTNCAGYAACAILDKAPHKPSGGLKLKGDRACIQMGKQGDVSICRSGDDELEISGDLNVAGDIKFNGKSIKSIFEVYEQLIKRIHALESKSQSKK